MDDKYTGLILILLCWHLLHVSEKQGLKLAASVTIFLVLINVTLETILRVIIWWQG